MADDGMLGGREECLYSKTEAGRAEIQTRAHKLSRLLRSILLLVDGSRDAATLRRMAADLHAPADALEQLAALGLIRNVHALSEAAAARPSSVISQRFRTVSSLMTAAVHEHLGLLGFFMQIKIERCADMTELEALLPDVGEAVAKARGFDCARQWERGIRVALAS
ncbi:hypothetical protein [Dokdonella sp.]|uniref:hypothetical protein n=1 Tax=Dokdonella sp. TaxID=2291710 RepID=UPI003782D5FB